MFNPRTANGFKPEEYWIIGTILLVGGLIGVILNLFVIYNLKKRPVFHCAFGRICMSHSIAACGNNATYGLMCNDSYRDANLHESYFGKRSGLFICLFWTAGILCHLLMAVNRFVCMYFPFQYPAIFTDRFTKNSIGLVWSLSFLVSVAQFIPSCECFIWIDNFNFEFYPNFCGILLGLYADFMMSVVCIGLVGILDFFTYLKIRKHFSVDRIQNLGTTGPGNQSTSKGNIKFFYQSAAQGFASGLEVITYFYISPHISNKWVRYCLSACFFLGVNVVDAIIVTVFNKEIRHLIYITKKERLQIEQALRTPTVTASSKPSPCSELM
uniref:7TM_GPCR_Srx domain-containing protein n=1 Tax=Steinernema glaseri TaxID=37863 RepID=A0A1I8AM23_9BILA